MKPQKLQECSICGSYTDRCEEDSLTVDDGLPLCESCYDTIQEQNREALEFAQYRAEEEAAQITQHRLEKTEEW